MKEHMGMPHFPDGFEEIEPKQTKDGVTFSCSAGFLDFGEYATTFGDLYEVVTREDGSLTVKKKNE